MPRRINASGRVANLTNGAIPRSWGAVAHSLAGGGLVLAGGLRGFEKVWASEAGLLR
jgi:hypothetical protein